MCTYVLHFVCFGEETWNCMHFLVILSLKSLWAGVKHWRTALHRFYVDRKPIDHLHDLAIWKWFKNVYISFGLKCIYVWCLDNWSRILSGKPFNTFSMARLKTLQFRLTLAPLFTSCNNVAPVTNLCLGRATTFNAVPFVTMEQKKSCSWNIKTHYLRFKHFIIAITDDPSPC